MSFKLFPSRPDRSSRSSASAGAPAGGAAGRAPAGRGTPGLSGAPGAMPPARAQEPIFNATAANFEERVLKASMTIPVVLDFWAPWCGPCKQLTPALEAAIRAAQGAVLLAKVNTDEEQDLAQAFRIQSIPTVYAVFQGQPVDGFQGAVPESQLKQFIARLAKLGGGAPLDTAQIQEQADRALAEGRAAEARDLYAQLLEIDRDNPKLLASLMRALIADGQVQEAEAMLAELPAALAQRGEFQPVRSSIQLVKELAVTTPAPVLLARLESDPGDHQARFDLACTRFAQGQREIAMDLLLDLMKAERGWNEDAARKQLLKFFDAMGPTDPLTLKGRRRLSSLLFS